MNKPAYYTWIGLLGFLVMVGVYSFYTQTVEGHYLTGVSDEVPWGIYIAAFAFFEGIAAGITVIGLMIFAFGREDYRPLGTRALLVGLFSLMGSMLFIMVDVGDPLKFVLIPWVLRNTSSPFFYTSLSYFIFGAILLAELYCVVRITQGKATDGVKKMARYLAIAAVPFALVVLVSLAGALFAFVKAREFWNNPMLPAHFAVAALVTGTAVMVLVAVKKSLVGKETLNHLGKLLAIFIAVTIFFDLFDIIVLNYSETPEGIEAWALLTGRHSLLFTVNIVGLVGALLIVLFKRGRTAVGLSIASILAILAIAAYRYNLVIVGQEVPLLQGSPEVHYSPTGIEISITVGITALAMLLYSVASRILPMEEKAS